MKSKFKFGYVCGNCEGYAFYLNERPRLGQQLHTDQVQYKDGTKPNFGDIVTCQQCGQKIGILRTERVKKVEK